MTGRDRGQAYTMEAIIAALLLLASAIFVMQATAVTSLSPTTSNQQIETQQTGAVSGLLETADANGSLHTTALYWNDTDGSFHGSGPNGQYVTGGPPTELGRLLNRTLRDQGVAFNLNVRYLSREGQLRTERVVFFGEPSDNAVRITDTATLHDDDVLYAADGTKTNTTLAESKTFYAPDAAPNSSVYNVLRVEVIVWRM